MSSNLEGAADINARAMLSVSADLLKATDPKERARLQNLLNFLAEGSLNLAGQRLAQRKPVPSNPSATSRQPL